MSHRAPALDQQDHCLPQLPHELELVPPVSSLTLANQIPVRQRTLVVGLVSEKADRALVVKEPLRRSWWRSLSSTSTTTKGGPRNDDPPITPEDGGSPPYEAL